MHLERIVKLAQKYVSDIPVIVLGSGASIPYGLPSMSDLANKLLAVLPKEQKDERTVDEDLRGFRNMIEQGEGLESALQNVNLSDEVVEQIICHTWEYINQCDLALYNQLIHEGVDLPLVDLLAHLLKTSLKKVNVVTTNYDRIAEYAADLAEATAYTGFYPGRLGGYSNDDIISASFKHPSRNGQVNILKVHGSLDWFVYKNRSKPRSFLQLLTIPNQCRPLIVTPGTGKYKETHGEPFRSLITSADTVIKGAKSFLCIGYGFNDEHIQSNLIEQVCDKDVPIILLTKQLTESARRLLLNGNCKNYLLLEQSESGGTRIYVSGSDNALEFRDLNIWDFRAFLRYVI